MLASCISVADPQWDVLESDNMVTGLHGGDTLANRFDDTGTLVAEDNRKSTLGVLSRERVRICGKGLVCEQHTTGAAVFVKSKKLTCVADTSV